jgi:opacity protein-like surface antigen
MKKLLVLGICLAAIGTSAFAQAGFKVSAGVGGFFQDYWTTMTMKYGGEENSSKMNYAGGGIFAFLDATYAELNIGMAFGSSKDDDAPDDYEAPSLTHLTLGLLGKYPIALSEKLTIFPLVGFDWNVFLSGKSGELEIKPADLKDMGDDYTDSYDAFLIDVGAGADFNIASNLFIRAELRWGFKLNSKREKDMLEEYNKMDGAEASIFSTGPKITLGVGYSF